MARKRRKGDFLQKMFPKRMQKKLVMLFMSIILAFILLIVRMTYINANHGEKYSKVVLDQQQYDSRVIPFKRGDIFERGGMKLATSERVYNVILDARVLLAKKDSVEITKQALLNFFEIEVAEVERILEENPKGRYNIMLKGISYNQAEEFKEYEASCKEAGTPIAGIWLEEDYVRKYPYGSLASDAIGFIVDGNLGSAGIESFYNAVLNGTDGREYGYFSEDATVERTVKEPVNGNHVVTTLDLEVQSIVERHLEGFNERYKNQVVTGPGAKNLAVLVMDPRTGGIVAMSSRPNFDLNNPRDLSYANVDEATIEAMTDEEYLQALNAVWKNFGVVDTYEAGSTIKPFTIATALETGILQGDEYYYCGGSLHVGGFDIHCANKRAHGTLSLSGVMEQSCNVATMQIAAQIGIENFTRYQSIFGFGDYTGIDLPGDYETSALIYNVDNMTPTDLATNSFGQGFNVNMLQLASGFASLINGGNYYEPHIVERIENADGHVLSSKQSVLVKKTVSPAVSDKLKEYMYETVERGTGTHAQVEGYAVGGKTGTAEKLPRGEGRYLSSFIGYAPQDNPEVMIYVILDEPNMENQSASALACELASDIMAEIFPSMQIARSE